MGIDILHVLVEYQGGGVAMDIHAIDECRAERLILAHMGKDDKLDLRVVRG